MNKKEILTELKRIGFPIQINENVKINNVCDTEDGVLFDFTFYGSHARAQYEIDGEEYSNIFSEVYDCILMDSFDNFCDENIELFISIHQELK